MSKLDDVAAEAGSAGAKQPTDANAAPQERTRWVGWITLAAVTAMIVGAMQAITGIIALVEDGFYVTTRSGFAAPITYTEWGWVHIIIGLALVAVGVGLLVGSMWARVLGVAIAGLSAIANFLFLPAYPVWSMVMITFDVLIAYAIVEHGGEVNL